MSIGFQNGSGNIAANQIKHLKILQTTSYFAIKLMYMFWGADQPSTMRNIRLMSVAVHASKPHGHSL